MDPPCIAVSMRLDVKSGKPCGASTAASSGWSECTDVITRAGYSGECAPESTWLVAEWMSSWRGLTTQVVPNCFGGAGIYATDQHCFPEPGSIVCSMPDRRLVAQRLKRFGTKSQPRDIASS